VTAELTVEATGETVSEAKWNALRELERRSPSVDKGAVRFQVVSEGERGLLGVGYSPARVVASVDADGAESLEPAAASPDDSPEAARVRALLAHVTAAIGIRCAIEVSETEDALEATCSGGDLALLIGKHGQTIDAVQTIANAMLGGEEGRKDVIVDAAGYRERRQRTIEGIAHRAAEEALRSQIRVELEPMSPAERRLVHECLKEYGGVETASEGDEPNRYVVVQLS
jgi:spoIIIJ-associated protein